MKKLVSLLLCLLMVTSMANFSSIVSAVTSIEFPQATADEVTPEESAETDKTAESELVEKKITGYYNGYVVEVSGMLPQVATLSLTSVSDETAQKLVSQKRSDGKAIFACDIKIIGVDGEEWQPKLDNPVEINVSGIENNDKEVQFLHISDDVDTVFSQDNPADAIDVITDVTVEDGTATFPTNSFSTFVGFTVDFHYNGQDFSIGGMESVLLSEVFNKLEIDKDIADVTDVTFTNDSLIRVEKQGEDWLLSSLEAFTSEEDLSITFKDGSVLVVDVTDAQTLTYAAGSSSGSATLSDDYNIYFNGDHTFTGTKTINAAKTITIYNNTDHDIVFTRTTNNEFFEMTKNGAKLIVKGKPGARIIFNSNGKTSGSIYSSTGGTSSQIQLEHCVFKGPSGRVNVGTALGKFKLTNCTFQDFQANGGSDNGTGGAALYINGAVSEKIELINCAFQNCRIVCADTGDNGYGAAIGFSKDSSAKAGVLLKYDDDFEYTMDASGNKITSAFYNCVVDQKDYDNIGGAIGVMCDGAGDISDFVVHVVPGTYIDKINIFDSCKAFNSGAISFSGGGTAATKYVTNVLFDYGETEGVLDDGADVDGVANTDNPNPNPRNRTGYFFKNCYAYKWGGVIFTESSHAKFIMDGVNAYQNTASDGGVIRTFDNITLADFQINDCFFDRNSAVVYDGTVDNFGGPVLRTVGAFGAHLKVNNSTFQNGYSHWSGAGLYWNAGLTDDTRCDITNCMFDSNHAFYSGGAIFNESEMTISATIFKNNSAITNGGAIRTTLYSRNSNKTWNKDGIVLTLDSGCKMINNTAGLYGGGLAINPRFSPNACYNWKEGKISKFDFGVTIENGAEVSGNKAGIAGGGIYYGFGWNDDLTTSTGWDSYFANDTSTTLPSMSSLTATVNATGQQRFVNKMNKFVNISGGVVKDNIAGYDGGGIYCNVNYTNVNISGGSVYGNRAGVDNVEINVTNVRKSGTTQFPLNAKLADTYKKTANTKIDSSATNPIDMYFETRTLMTDASAVGYGGGVCVKGTGSTVTMTGGDIGIENPGATEGVPEEVHRNGNRADFGGAIAVKDATLNFEGGDLAYNYAYAGGGIFTIGSGTMNMSDGNIKKNHADGMRRMITTTAPSSGTTVTSQCIKSSDNVGLKYCLAERTSTIVNAFATGSGGGINAHVGTVNLTGGNVEGNTATDGAGGGVWVDDGGDVDMTGGSLVGNIAEYSTAPSGNTTLKEAALKGVGGAVGVGNGTSSNSSTYRLEISPVSTAIYDNVAMFAADDVYSSGSYTQLTIPNTGEMDIPNPNNLRRKITWFEDFHTSDSNFSASNSISSVSSSSLVERYRVALENEEYNKLIQIFDTNSRTGSAKYYVNQANAYVNMTLGISESGGLKVGKSVKTPMGIEDNESVNQWNTFTITGASGAEAPKITGIFKMNENNAMIGGTQVYAADDKTTTSTVVKTDYFETLQTGSTYKFKMKNGYYVGFDARGTYSVAESEVASGVTETYYKTKNGNENYSSETLGTSVSGLVVESVSPKEVEFINIVAVFEFTFKYYDRKIENGKPSDISSQPSTISYTLMGDKYEAAVSGITSMKDKLNSMALAASAEACALVDNIVDEYDVNLGANANTTLHTDQYGTTITDTSVADPYWINWYNGSGKAQSVTNDTDAAKVTSGVIWLKNMPKIYNVKVNVPAASKSGSVPTYYSRYDEATLTAAQTTKLKTADDGGRYVYTDPAESISTYYNQRIGAKYEGTDTDNVNDNINRLIQYKKNGETLLGYTGRDVISPASVKTSAGKTLYFSHWSYDEEGYVIASTDQNYHSRIVQDTTVYAVYMEEPIEEKGLTVSNNVVDIYVENDTERVRINTLVNPYNFQDNFGKDNFNNLAGVYAIPQGNVRITSAHVVDLQNWILDYLNTNAPDGIATAGNRSVKITAADINKYPKLSSLKGANFVLYSKPPVTNKNRVNMEITFDKTKLANNRMLTFAAINYNAENTNKFWRISDNCIDYQFDENGNNKSASSINEVAIVKTPSSIQIVGTATGGSATNAVNMTLNTANKNATYTVDLAAGTYNFYINELYSGSTSAYGYTGSTVTDSIGDTDMTEGTTPVTLKTSGGRYIITYDYANKQFSIVRKVPTVTMSGGIAGTMSTVSGTNVQLTSGNLTAGTTYTFAVNEKIDSTTEVFGSSTTINNTVKGLQLSTSVNSCKFVPTTTGKYTFTYDYVTNKLTVALARPLISITGAINATDDDMTAGAETVSYTVELATGNYNFNIVETTENNSVTYGKSVTINDNTTSEQLSATNTACTLKASGGTYVFTYNYELNQITVTRKCPTVTISGAVSGTMTDVAGTSTVEFTSAELAVGKHSFNINETMDGVTVKYGNGQTAEKFNNVEVTANGSACVLDVKSAGAYVFTYDYVNNTLTVKPDMIPLALVGDGVLNISADQWVYDDDYTVATATVDLPYGNNSYNFHIEHEEVIYGGGSISNVVSGQSLTVNGTSTLKAYGGAYTFEYTLATQKLTITHKGAVVIYHFCTKEQAQSLKQTGSDASYTVYASEMTDNGSGYWEATTSQTFNKDGGVRFKFFIDGKAYYYKGSGGIMALTSSNSGRTMVEGTDYGYGYNNDSNNKRLYFKINKSTPTSKAVFITKS